MSTFGCHGPSATHGLTHTLTATIEAHGYRVLRVSNHDVLRQIDSVLDTIAAQANPDEMKRHG